MSKTYSQAILSLLEKPNNIREEWMPAMAESYPLIPLFKIREDLELSNPAINNISTAISRYEKYVNELSKTKIDVGYNDIDKKIRGIAPGETLGIWARTAVGKTIFAINIIKRILENKANSVLFFSLEQETPQILERLSALTEEKGTAYIEKMFKNNVSSDIVKNLMDKYKNLLICDKGGLSFPEMGELIYEGEKAIGKKIPVVVIDYLGYMRGKGSTTYERASLLAKESKEFAKKHKIALIIICQLSREGKSGGEPVTLNMCRDSGVLEESFDYVLGIWRPALSEDATDMQKILEPEEFKIRILKNRSGRTGDITLYFEKDYLGIKER